LDEKGGGTHKSSLALEQAVEVAEGILPRELTLFDELPPKYQKMWPTPSKHDFQSPQPERIREREGILRKHNKVSGNDFGPKLTDVYSYRTGGQLNPPWVEWLMGWPIGWTDLRPLETDKFQQWLQQFGGC
jgi:hypothetical protein